MSRSLWSRGYHEMSADEQRAFNRWLAANAVLASIGAVALLAMAVAASDWPQRSAAAARAGETVGVSAPALHDTRSGSPYELMVRYAPDQLPQQQVDAPY